MRKIIFVISILIFLLSLFGIYMDIGMRGDQSILEVLIKCLPLFMLPVLFVIIAFIFMKQRTNITVTKKWPRVGLIIFFSFLLLYASVISWGNSLMGLVIFIIFGVPIWYLTNKGHWLKEAKKKDGIS